MLQTKCLNRSRKTIVDKQEMNKDLRQKEVSIETFESDPNKTNL